MRTTLRKRCAVVAGAGLTALVCSSSPAFAQGYLGGNLAPFAIVGATTVTCTGATVVRGDIGLSPGSSVTGFPVPCTDIGTIHIADAPAGLAQADLTTAFNTLTGLPCGLDLTGTDLGGLTLTPGVYCFSSTAQLTGLLTLNALGDPNAVWVFQIGSTLTTAGNVLMTNGGNPCGVQWRVGTSATLGLGSQMVGNVLAQSAITLVNGANLIGRALARTAAVTLDNNQVSFLACGAASAPPPFPGAPVPTLTQWAMIALTLLLMAAGVIAMRRKRAHGLRVKRS